MLKYQKLISILAIIALSFGSAVYTVGCKSDNQGLVEEVPKDSDGDTVLDDEDINPLDARSCLDEDNDDCDDCSVNSAPNTADDGIDTDSDGKCDISDIDDDGDSVLDASDVAPQNNFVCRDIDNDTCDDCSVEGFADPSNDGPDPDHNGICTPNDADGDTVENDSDINPNNPFACRDTDADSCDDCSAAGVPNIANDGLDTDADGRCNAGDADDDNDNVPDNIDLFATDNTRCLDFDKDSCDDCSVAGKAQPNNDGLDTDADGKCNVGDIDDDNDLVVDSLDRNSLSALSCRDVDADGCDDCIIAKKPQPSNDGVDTDKDGICDAGDSVRPTVTTCTLQAVVNSTIPPFVSNSSVNLAAHNRAEIVSANGTSGFEVECAAKHGQAMEFLTAIPTSGCKNNSTSSWSAITTYKVLSQASANIQTRGFTAGETCGTVTLATAPAQCLGNANGCKLATGLQGHTLNVHVDPSFHQAPSASRPLETYPFMTEIRFKAWVHGEDNSGKLIVKIKRPDGSVVEAFNQAVRANQSNADANAPYVVRVPGANGGFISGLDSIQFGHSNGPIAIKDVVIVGRKN